VKSLEPGGVECVEGLRKGRKVKGEKGSQKKKSEEGEAFLERETPTVRNPFKPQGV